MTKETYTWIAICQDGTDMQEYDASRPDGRAFSEIDATQIRQIKLESSDNALRSHYVDIPSHALPVFFRRRKVELNPNEQKQSTVHCIGWKRENEACYLFVDDNGNTLLTDNLQAV
jgi:hypothetical protein